MHSCLHVQEHFREIVPEAEVDARVAMYNDEDEEALLEGSPDFVLDAIDNIDTKVALLAACKRRGIPVLCAAGAGTSCWRIQDLSRASPCPDLGTE